MTVGDVAAVRETGRRQWKLIELKPALEHVVRDVLAHYQDRFPDAPFFVPGCSTGKGDGVADFAPMIGSLHAQQQHRTEVLQIYAGTDRRDVGSFFNGPAPIRAGLGLLRVAASRIHPTVVLRDG